MSDEVRDLRNRIHRLEDNLLRCKDFQEQFRMHQVLNVYRKQLQRKMFEGSESFGE